MTRIFTKSGFLAIFFGMLSSVNLLAQIDRTDWIVNPSFETGDYTGWTWTGWTGGWQNVNDDGDATKDGNYIAGHWNEYIADVECYQEIEVPNGTYRVSALITVSSSGRLSNQRLFANNNSTLYGSEGDPAYSETNLDILTNLGETYTFAGIECVETENGPFVPISVTTEVTDGLLKLGVKFSGEGSVLGYDFFYEGVSSRHDVGFFKFDGFTLEEVESSAIQTIRIDANEIVDIYSLTGIIVSSGITKKEVSQTLSSGFYILKSQNKTEKIIISERYK
jgi:hypothetical protein